MLEGKYKNFYLMWRSLSLDDPLYLLYETISYILEDIDDYEAQFKEIYEDLKTFRDKLNV